MTSEYLNCAEKYIECICPKCGKKHIKFIYYTGREKVPKFFCTNCRRLKEVKGVLNESE